MDAQGMGGGKPGRSGRFFYGWFIVAILFFISIIDGGFTYIFSAFLKPLSQEFGWTRAETAGAFSLYLLAAGLVLPLWGWLADHGGVRLVFLLSALIDGLALFLLSSVRSLTAFHALYLFLGVGLGGIGPMTVGKVISQWFVAKRGRAMGIALVGAGSGGLILVPFAGFLIAEFSWRIAYQGLAALALGGMLPLVWFFLTDTPQEKGLMPLRQESPAAAITAHQVAFLQDAGLTLEMASTIAGVTLGLSMGGRFAVGWASEHTRHLHHILSFCLIMQAVGIGLLSCLSALGFWVLAIFVPLFGLGYGGLIVLWPLTVGHDFGLRSFGAIAGVVGTVALSLGGALGPVVAGAMYDSTGSYQWAFLSGIGVLLVGAAAAVAATEPRAVRPVAT